MNRPGVSAVSRILIIKGQSQYGGTRLFADEAAQALAKRGHNVGVLDIEPSHAIEADVAEAAAMGPFDLVFSINILGDYRSLTGQTMAELFGCPQVVWHTDYILASWPRLQNTPPETLLLTVDPSQIEGLSLAAGPGRHRTGFFPHPGVGAPMADDADAEAFAAARPIPVLWSGSYPQRQSHWASAPDATRRVLEGAVEQCLAVDWLPPHVALAQALAGIGMDLADPAMRHNLAAAWLIDTEVRTRRREAFLAALAESSVELHICGEAWEPHLHRFKGATYHGAVPMMRMVELMRQSRVVLNTNGNFGAGAHERPFSAALAGAACLSDVSLYYLSEMKPGEDIELFSWLDLPGAMERLRRLAADPERCWRMGAAAKATTLAAHTWDRQVGDILTAAGLGP